MFCWYSNVLCLWCREQYWSYANLQTRRICNHAAQRATRLGRKPDERGMSDVQIEPGLLPANQEELRAQTNGAPKARLDIAARGMWSQGKKTYFDVRVTHTNALSNRGKTLDQIYRQNENEKKNLYNERIINVEKSSFTPLVFSTSGGMAPECLKLNKRIAELLAHKRNEQYSVVMSFIRTRLRFALLKSTLISIRGYRGKQTMKSKSRNIFQIQKISNPDIYFKSRNIFQIQIHFPASSNKDFQLDNVFR